MKFSKRLMAIIPAVLLLGAACASAATPTAAPTATQGTSGVSSNGGGSGVSGSTGVPSAEQSIVSSSMGVVPVSFSSGQSSYYTSATDGSGQQGIWVVGSGMVTVDPDLAQLMLGVESLEDTVQAAQAAAATTLDAMITTLMENGVAEEDIRTQHFSVQPIITYVRVSEGGREYSEQRIDGYRVSNSIVAEIRELDKVGDIIDLTVAAGGDLVRVNGITFTVEDQAAAHTVARELATKDAIAKAQQFGDLLSITVGPPVFVTELGRSGPILQEATMERFAVADMAGAAPSTPILAGDLTVSAQVQVVFAIQ